MQVLTGPPGSGKTGYVLNQVRSKLKQGAGFRLIVPTNTMAEHLRNQLAREGFVFRPGAVVTFSKFVESLIPDLPKVSAAALELLVEDAISQLPLKEFARVKGYPGFRKAVVGQIQELVAAGISSADLRRNRTLDEFSRIFEWVELDVARRGWYFAPRRLRQAATRVCPVPNVILHGFFSFTSPELEIVAALARLGDVLITLPSWKGSDDALDALRGMGFREIACPDNSVPAVQRVLVTAPTADQEAEEIARRILAEHDAGREFREIGIIVRSAYPGGAVLRCALERFGIPARFYFGEPLGENPVVAYLASVVGAMLGGWEHGDTLAAMRRGWLPGGIEADEFEYRVRAAPPGRGLPALRLLADGRYLKLFEQLQQIDGWRTGQASAHDWAARFRSLTGLFPHPEIADSVTPDWLAIWRAQAAALAGFEASVEELGGILDPEEKLRCTDYWAKLKTVIDANMLRIPDNRRNVVHVIDAYEARQWKLPVIFLCGLLEKHFPKHHSESPLLADRDRLQLRSSGIHLRTAFDRHEEEQFLFELATSRATAKLVLSYPLLNAKGDANLPSFFLEKLRQQGEFATGTAARCRPTPEHELRTPAAVSIYDETLREVLKTRYSSISATAIESFLQCPFLFFARNTLQLQEPPAKPEDRLNVMLQGNIAHGVLHRMYSTGELLEEAFAGVWNKSCHEHRVPAGYRTEAVRLELFRNLKTFARANRLPRTSASEFERTVQVKLNGSTEITGRIDRIDVDAAGRALIVDYKYKREKGITELVKTHNEGLLVQGGLYVHAMRAAGYEPAGMVYAGFRREASTDGWIAGDAFPGLTEGITAEALNDVVRRSTEVALTAIGQIHDGRIATSPADVAKCDYCAFADACRVETIALQKVKRSIGE